MPRHGYDSSGRLVVDRGLGFVPAPLGAFVSESLLETTAASAASVPFVGVTLAVGCIKGYMKYWCNGHPCCCKWDAADGTWDCYYTSSGKTV